jgi:site-specific recombinase XerD
MKQEQAASPFPLVVWERPARMIPTNCDDLSALIEDFLIYGRQRGYSVSTLKSYREAVDDFLDFFRNVDLRTLKPRDIREWLHWLMSQGRKRNTLTARMYAIRAFFDRAVLLDLMPSNPARLLPMRSYNRPLPKFLSEEETVRLIDGATSPRDRAILEVFYATGCRVAEVAGMRVEDINWSARTVLVTGKGHKQRLVPLGRKAIEALRLYLRQRTKGPVFLSSEVFHYPQRGGLCLQGRAWYAWWREEVDGKRKLRGSAIGKIEEFPTRELARAQATKFLARKDGVLGTHEFSRRSSSDAGLCARDLARIIQRAATVAGLQRKVHPHMLRHTCATHLLEHGADLVAIRDILGHSSVLTTQIYASVSAKHMEATMRRCHPRWQQEEAKNEASK